MPKGELLMKIERVESILDAELKTRLSEFDEEIEIADYLIKGNSALEEIEHQIEKLGLIAFEVARLHALTYSVHNHILENFEILKIQYHKKKKCCDENTYH